MNTHDTQTIPRRLDPTPNPNDGPPAPPRRKDYTRRNLMLTMTIAMLAGMLMILISAYVSGAS